MMLSTASEIVIKRSYNCYLDVKIANQKIHTVVNYKSPDEPSPCLLRTPENRLLDWVTKPRPSGLTWGREFLTEELLCQFLAWLRMSEWAQLRGCEREREGGEGGEVWRGGWGEHTHTHIPPSITTVMRTMGRSLWKATGLTQGTTPMSKHWLSHSHCNDLLTFSTTNSLEQNDGILTFCMWNDKAPYQHYYCDIILCYITFFNVYLKYLKSSCRL